MDVEIAEECNLREFIMTLHKYINGHQTSSIVKAEILKAATLPIGSGEKISTTRIAPDNNGPRTKTAKKLNLFIVLFSFLVCSLVRLWDSFHIYMSPPMAVITAAIVALTFAMLLIVTTLFDVNVLPVIFRER